MILYIRKYTYNSGILCAWCVPAVTYTHMCVQYNIPIFTFSERTYTCGHTVRIPSTLDVKHVFGRCVFAFRCGDFVLHWCEEHYMSKKLAVYLFIFELFVILLFALNKKSLYIFFVSLFLLWRLCKQTCPVVERTQTLFV